MEKYNKYFIDVKLNLETVYVYTVRKIIQGLIDRHLDFFQGVLVDLGCGEMPYRQYLFDKCPKLKKYIGVDVKFNNYHQTLKPDIYWNGKKIPLKNKTADIVMATELFEHVDNLAVILKEIRRVLRPQGLLFFTVPFIWPLHETPHDEFRYTPYSLNRFLKKAGFTTITILPTGGSNASLALVLGIWSRLNYPKSKLFFPIIKYLLDKDLKQKPLAYGENTMTPGFYGYAKK